MSLLVQKKNKIKRDESGYCIIAFVEHYHSTLIIKKTLSFHNQTTIKRKISRLLRLATSEKKFNQWYL